MLIGIDGFELSEGERVGVGRLAVEVIGGLQRIDKKNRYRVYVPGEGDSGEKRNVGYGAQQLASPIRNKNNWEYKYVKQTRLWSQVTLPFYLWRDRPRPDLFLSPSHYIPRFCPCPAVNFVFDLSYLYYPKLFKRTDLYKLRNWTYYSVAKAVRVITISEASRLDIIRFYKVDSDKIKVVYPGIMKQKANSKEQITKNKEQKAILKKYGICGDYILYVGTLQPRKNLARLIEAFNKVKSKGEKLKLVIVGKKGWMYKGIFGKVKELSLEKDVIFTGFVPDEELPVFYKNAKLFALVSLYEGFGLPVLEAMSYGTPVVVSNTSSLPEVAGDAGIYVNPEDKEDIADKIFKVLKMSKAEYKQVSDKCKKQASKFSWEKTAKQVLEVLKEAVE